MNGNFTNSLNINVQTLIEILTWIKKYYNLLLMDLVVFSTGQLCRFNHAAILIGSMDLGCFRGFRYLGSSDLAHFAAGANSKIVPKLW